jgi:hypothetical protein
VMRLQNWSLQAGWQANATEEENNMGDQDDLPFDVYEEEELQSSRLQKKSQLAEQLEEVIEEVRRVDVEVSTRNC